MRRGDLGMGMFFALAALCGCGSKSDASHGEAAHEIAECNDYMAKYAHCIGRLSPEGENDARIAATRTRFTPPLAEAERETQRTACVTGLKQLAAACK